MIKVLIVEDSPVVLELLRFIISSDPDMQIAGTATNGKAAIEAVKNLRPDVVTMDVVMPVMDGFEAARIIMETTPTPIVIVSESWDPKEVEKVFRAMEAGALAAIRKPVGAAHPDFKKQSKELIQTVKLMSEVKVVKRKPWIKEKTVARSAISANQAQCPASELKMVAIGASTGGPPVIETILSGIPKDFSAPLLIVQHIAAGFVQGFAQWLANSCKLPVKVAAHGEYPLPGRVYIAPDNLHMGVETGGRIFLSTGEPENGLRPSVSCLFRSVAKVFGKNAAGVLLSGMGKDGANELKLMRENGAATIVQDKDSAVVYGMPGEAVALNAAAHILAPAKIAEFLTRLSTINKNVPRNVKS